jgi:hypothetical protein
LAGHLRTVVAKTKIFFIVIASAALVVEHASAPPAIQGAIHFLFVIAAALRPPSGAAN